MAHALQAAGRYWPEGSTQSCSLGLVVVGSLWREARQAPDARKHSAGALTALAQLPRCPHCIPQASRTEIPSLHASPSRRT